MAQEFIPMWETGPAIRHGVIGSTTDFGSVRPGSSPGGGARADGRVRGVREQLREVHPSSAPDDSRAEPKGPTRPVPLFSPPAAVVATLLMSRSPTPRSPAPHEPAPRPHGRHPRRRGGQADEVGQAEGPPRAVRALHAGPRRGRRPRAGPGAPGRGRGQGPRPGRAAPGRDRPGGRHRGPGPAERHRRGRPPGAGGAGDRRRQRRGGHRAGAARRRRDGHRRDPGPPGRRARAPRKRGDRPDRGRPRPAGPGPHRARRGRDRRLGPGGGHRRTEGLHPGAGRDPRDQQRQLRLRRQGPQGRAVPPDHGQLPGRGVPAPTCWPSPSATACRSAPSWPRTTTRCSPPTTARSWRTCAG